MKIFNRFRKISKLLTMKRSKIVKLIKMYKLRIKIWPKINNRLTI